MGRKPNQLILEFFHRGPKLEDASNRYQHTCKACGEVFPKGRIDSLTNHLVKKCQAIPLRDRQRVLLRLHELPDLTDGDSTKDSPTGKQGKAGENGFPNRQNFDGLNVLAEASRQVGASDVTKRPGYTQSVTAGGKTVIVDPALEAEGFQGQTQGPDKIDANAEGMFTIHCCSHPITDISQELLSRPTLLASLLSRVTLLTSTTNLCHLLLEPPPCRLNPHPMRDSLSCH
jgi:hypothetical protein